MINAAGGVGVTFDEGEGSGSILKNLIIESGNPAISIIDSSPTIENVTMVNNVDGIIASGTSSPDISNCILWNNDGDDVNGCQIQYSCIEDGGAGTGNISNDPLFVNPDGRDFHLKSQAGRWDPASESWVTDSVTSPAVDAGDPGSSIGHEVFPNGGKINMGAHGGTVQASKAYFGGPVCQKNIAGDINGDCKVDFEDFALMAGNWMENNNPL